MDKDTSTANTSSRSTGVWACAPTRLARAQLPLFIAAQWAVLPGIVRRERVDLVNAHWIVPQGLNAAVWRRAFGLPDVTTAHGADVAFLARSRVRGPLTRLIFSQTDYLIGDSEHLALEVERRFGRPVLHRAIPLGMSQALFRPDGGGVNPPANLPSMALRVRILTPECSAGCR